MRLGPQFDGNTNEIYTCFDHIRHYGLGVLIIIYIEVRVSWYNGAEFEREHDGCWFDPYLRKRIVFISLNW